MNVRFEGFTKEGLAFLDDEQARLLDSVRVSADDVLLNITGASIGRVTRAPDHMDGARVNQHVCIIRPVDGVVPAFVEAHLASPATQGQIFSEEYGVTRQALTKEQILGFSLALPPLPEQRRIVAKLDELRARSRKAREALDEVPALLDKLKQSVLAAAFRGDLTAEWRAAQPPGSVEPASVLLDCIRAERRKRWEQANPKKKYVEPEPVDTEGLPELPEGWCWAPFEELTPSDAAIVYGIIQPGPHIPDGVPFVRPADIQGGKIDFEALPRTSPEIARDYRRAALLPGDLVYSIVGTIGKWIIAGEDLRGANITQSSVRLRPAAPLSAKFFAYALASPILTAQIGRMLFGNAVQRLNVDHVRKLAVPIPATKEWAEIERKITVAFDAIHRTAERVAGARGQVDSLDQSILAKAFRGELVPQDPNDESAEKLLARIKAEAGNTGEKKSGRKSKAATT
jgi:type I restriction enzyme S subunit